MKNTVALGMKVQIDNEGQFQALVGVVTKIFKNGKFHVKGYTQDCTMSKAYKTTEKVDPRNSKITILKERA